MANRVDLRELAGGRNGATPSPPPVRRRWSWFVFGARYVIPLLLVAGFVGVLSWALRDSFVQRVPVTVMPVLAVRTDVETPEAPLFQAAGWVEPRPTPVIVSALEEGVVERLDVIEGQLLKAGDEIARLIDAEAKLAVREAEAQVAAREAEKDSAQANLEAAETRLREPLERQNALAEAEAMLAKVESDLARIPAQLRAANARLALASKEVESRTQSEGGVSKLAVARSEAEAESAEAAIAELQAQQRALKNEQAVQFRRVDVLRRQLELKTEEIRAVADGRAAVALADSRLASAKVVLEREQLRLGRMTIRAPTAGRVLSLDARPGTKVMGLKPAGMADAATVITMYDPDQLQVRADVRLEDVSRVRQGQPVQIVTAAVGQPLAGHVIATTSFTDIQKNTVQVKVSIDDPPEVLKPDMLVQVTFLAPATVSAPKTGETAPMRLVIPADVPAEENGEVFVWVADSSKKVARRKSVQLGGLTPQGSREVTGGLSLGDRVILNPPEALEPGTSIEIHEDMGRSHSTGNKAPARLPAN